MKVDAPLFTFADWARKMLPQDITKYREMERVLQETNSILDDMKAVKWPRKPRRKRKQRPPVFPFMLTRQKMKAKP